MATYVPVVFNEGAPLDPQKLMDLQSNVSAIFTDVGKLKNSSNGSQYTVVTDFGSVTTGPIEANKLSGPTPLSTEANLENYGKVKFIVSLASPLIAGEYISLTVNDKNELFVSSNKARTKGVVVNWIGAVQKIG
jgi:hypothetical protein